MASRMTGKGCSVGTDKGKTEVYLVGGWRKENREWRRRLVANVYREKRNVGAGMHGVVLKTHEAENRSYSAYNSRLDGYVVL